MPVQLMMNFGVPWHALMMMILGNASCSSWDWLFPWSVPCVFGDFTTKTDPDRHEFHRSLVFANLHGRSRKLRATKYRLICGFLWFSTKYIWRGEKPGQWTNQLGDFFAAVGSTQTGRVPVGDELCRCFRWRMRDELLDIWIHPMQSHKHCMLFIYWDSVCISNVFFPVSHVYISILGFKQDIRTNWLKAWLDTLVIFEVWLGTVLRCREWTLWVGSVALMEEAQTQTRPEGVEDWFQVLPNLFLGHVKERNCDFMNFTQSTCFCVQEDMHRTYFISKNLFMKNIFIYNIYIDLQNMERLDPWNQLSKVGLGRLGGSLGSALGKTDALPLSLGWSPDSFWNQGCASVDLAWSLVEDFKGAITRS